jgi:hypothetical protein
MRVWGVTDDAGVPVTWSFLIIVDKVGEKV